MNQPNASTLTLFDLLARRWQAEAAVAEIRFSDDGRATAFTTIDGALRIAGPDTEPPEKRIRVTGDLGQTTIRPRAKPVPPLVALPDLAETAPPLAADEAGFLVGHGDGRVLRIAPDGSAELSLTLASPVVALDHAGGVTAAADAETLVLRTRDRTTRRSFAATRALALTRDGARLAAAGPDSLTLVQGAEEDRRPIAGAARLRWRSDGDWLAAALGPEGVALVAADDPAPSRLAGFPAPVLDLGWSAPGRAFVAAGAYRVAAWAAEEAPASDRPLVTGQPGFVLVTAVAAHPARPLVAAGYANGQVVIAALGGRDELLLRQGGGAVTCLAFSPDGRELAIGDADGALAIAAFPPQLFK